MKTFLFTIISSMAICLFAYSEDSQAVTFIPAYHALLQMKINEVPINEITSDETQATIDLMYWIASGQRQEGDKFTMVGLAAPQIGINKCIILIDVGVEATRRELGTLHAYINPRIVWASDDLEEGREGCYSVDNRMVGIVARASRIYINAYDRQGNEINTEFSGFTARIFQHEIDHLNGVRFPDRVGKDGVLQCVSGTEYVAYRDNWQNWPIRCSWDSWVAMKAGQPYELPCKAN